MTLAEILCAAYMSLGLMNADIACEHMPHLVEESQKHSVPPELMVSLIYTESRWTPSAISRANACGLTQVIPKWTGGRATGGIKYTCKQLTDNPKLSISVGTRIYSYWLRNYGRCGTSTCRPRHHRVALCGYNAGYRCKGATPNRSGMNYARIVLRRSRTLANRSSRIRRNQ